MMYFRELDEDVGFTDRLIEMLTLAAKMQAVEVNSTQAVLSYSPG